jgi:hypothetical protein
MERNTSDWSAQIPYVLVDTILEQDEYLKLSFVLEESTPTATLPCEVLCCT